MCVCYRPPDQEEQVDGALYRQIEAASHLHDLVLMGNFKHPVMCWRDNRAGHKQTRRYLEHIHSNFLLQVNEEPVRRHALLDLILANKLGFTGDVKIKGSLCCSDHEMLDSRILRAGRRVKSKMTTLDFKISLEKSHGIRS